MFDLKVLFESLEPFLEGQKSSEFLREIKTIPNYEEVVKNLINNDKEWQEAINNYGICYFLIDEIPLKQVRLPDNQVELRLFCRGTCPTIKVTKFI